MKWEVKYLDEAVDDLKKLDSSSRIKVIKKINRVSENPISYQDGGYGKPLGNHVSSKLAGFFKIKLQKPAIRVVYKLVRDGNLMQIIVISVRDDEEVYKLANKRRNSQ